MSVPPFSATAHGGAAVEASVAVGVSDGDGAAVIADGGVGLEVGKLAVEEVHLGGGFLDDEVVGVLLFYGVYNFVDAVFDSF